jgi:5-methylcytosine-specific restriction endonuclease McrA
VPIKPENASRYPPDWDQIRARILARAGNRCENCALGNGSTGYRDEDGAFISALSPGHCIGYRWFRIVLTVAHLDHTPEHCDDDNLRALCQKCHLKYDQEHHQRNARETRRARKAIEDMFI